VSIKEALMLSTNSQLVAPPRNKVVGIKGGLHRDLSSFVADSSSWLILDVSFVFHFRFGLLSRISENNFLKIILEFVNVKQINFKFLRIK
jgi:hypothetical protein